MKKLLALVPAVFLAAACGSDTKSCESAAAPLAAVGSSGCTLAAGTPVRIGVRADCGSCSETSPSCEGEVLGTDIELNPVFRVCQEDRGCPNTGCAFNRFDCTFVAPAVSGTYRLVYPTAGGLGQQNVVIGAGGSTSCTLAAAGDPLPAP